MSCSTAEEKRISTIAADRDYWRVKCLENDRQSAAEEVAGLKQALTELAARVGLVYHALLSENNSPRGAILDTLWMQCGTRTVFDELESIYQAATAPKHKLTTGYDPEVGFVLDFANAGELAAYDQASNECLAAVTDILDGKHRPGGVANEPWETVRRRLLNLVAENQHARRR